jgi:hypothetical protein
MVRPAHRGQHSPLQEHSVNKFIFSAAIVAAVAVPAIANAQTATGPMVCHTAAASETANAAMGSTKLVCRAVDVAKVMAAQKSLMSMMPKTMTAAQMKQMQADQDVFNLEFNLPKIPGGGSQPDR